MRLALLAFLAVAAALFGCAGSAPQPQNLTISAPVIAPVIGPASPPAGNSSQLANPASVNCVSKGYRLEIRADASGGQAGYCIFPDGNECEEWAFFRGNCTDQAAGNVSAEGESCGGAAAVPCAAGLDCVRSGSSPGASGTCVNQSSFSACGPTRPSSCPALNQPVCGRSGESESLYDYEDYSSSCVACSKTSPATGYYIGTCAQNNMTAKAGDANQLYYCPSDRAQACTQVNDPVCGRLVDATSSVSYYRDYSSPCTACAATSNAIAYYLGTCAGRSLA